MLCLILVIIKKTYMALSLSESGTCKLYSFAGFIYYRNVLKYMSRKAESFLLKVPLSNNYRVKVNREHAYA